MNNIILIVGLPGSGKTNLADKINLDNNGKYRIVDDPTNLNTQVLPYINDDLIITDPSLCIPDNREKAMSYLQKKNPNAKIDWIFFENDPIACLNNSNKRNEDLIKSNKSPKKVKSYISYLSSLYTIPKGSTIIKVYR